MQRIGVTSTLRLLTLPLLAAVAACAPPKIDTKKAETVISDEMKSHGVTMTQVSCPSGLSLKKGETFQCTGTDEQGTRAVFDVTVADSQGNVTWKLEGKYMDMKVEGDAIEKAISQKLGGKPVDVSCPSKNVIIAKGTTFSCDIRVGAESAKITLTFTSNDGDTYDYKITDTTGGTTYRWEVSSATNMKMEVPNTWNRQINGDVMVIASPTPGVGLELVAATGGLEAKGDEQAMLRAVGRTLSNARLSGGVRPAHQHGLSGFVANGTGQKNGADVQWFTAVLGDGKGHALLALGMLNPNAGGDYKAQLSHVLDSIQPAG